MLRGSPQKRMGPTLNPQQEAAASGREINAITSSDKEGSKRLKRPSNIEVEGIATRSKRVKPTSEHRNSHGKEITSPGLTVDLADGAEAERRPHFQQLPNSPKINIDEEDKERKETKPQSKKRDLLERYRRSSGSRPDYGYKSLGQAECQSPSASVALKTLRDPLAVPIRTMHKKLNISGAFVPRSTFSQPEEKQGSSKVSDPKSKTFDLTNNKYQHYDVHTAKRQKIDNSHGSKSTIPAAGGGTEYIIPVMSPLSGTSVPTRTGQSNGSHVSKKTLASNDATSLSEFQAVELKMKFKRKNRRGQSSQNLKPRALRKEDNNTASISIDHSEAALTILDYETVDSDSEDIVSHSASLEITKSIGKATGKQMSERETQSKYFPQSANGAVRPLVSVQIEDLTGDDDENPLPSTTENGGVKGRSHRNAGIMRQFAKKQSESVSRKGDLPPTPFQRGKNRSYPELDQQPRAPDVVYDLQNIFSGHVRPLSEKAQVFQLRLDSHLQNFELCIDGHIEAEMYPQLVVKLDKIQKLIMHPKSTKIAILRPIEKGIEKHLFIEFGTAEESARFVEQVHEINGTPNIETVLSSTLDQMFNRSWEKYTEWRESQSKSSQQELSLLKIKQARRYDATASNRVKGVVDKDPTANDDDVSRKIKITDKLSSSSVHEVPKASQKLNKDSASSNHDFPDFQRSDSKTGSSILGASRRTTRSSLRSETVDIIGQKTRSIISRWTESNPGWSNHWDGGPLVFPAEGRNKSTVNCEDIERLDEEQYLNDNIITFYLRYLESRLEKERPQVAKRIFFMNTFFYPRLTSGKGRSPIDYDAVKRWTSKVDLFMYDYIVVPVVENFHWYLAIICNAPRLLYSGIDDESRSEDFQNILNSGGGDADANEAIEVAGPTNLQGTKSPLKKKSSSPSVIEQVEKMTLEDEEQEWPEAEDFPEGSTISTPFLKRRSSRSSTRPKLEDQLPAEGSSPPIAATPQTLSKSKKGKKKFFPNLRKYDPSEPRIMTLDSLGNSHSPTCSNLRTYLICEAKARHDQDIQPEALGMTVKEIPVQPNPYDCGVYLLGYAEKFLEDPDKFVRKVLQREMDVKADWPDMKAPVIRETLRDLIFKLREEQTQKEKAHREERIKAKRAASKTHAPKPPESRLDQKVNEASHSISRSLKDQKSNDDDADTLEGEWLKEGEQKNKNLRTTKPLKMVGSVDPIGGTKKEISLESGVENGRGKSEHTISRSLVSAKFDSQHHTRDSESATTPDSQISLKNADYHQDKRPAGDTNSLTRKGEDFDDLLASAELQPAAPDGNDELFPDYAAPNVSSSSSTIYDDALETVQKESHARNAKPLAARFDSREPKRQRTVKELIVVD